MLNTHTATNGELDRKAVEIDRRNERRKHRFYLVPFDEIQLGAEPRYLVKGLIPRIGLTVIWGPPKSGKSFWTFDLAMCVALGRDYRGRRVQQGPVVYCAFEGQSGLNARVEAYRQRFPIADGEAVPFYLEPVTLDLVADHAELIATIKRQLNIESPVLVVLDTLNRSLRGSENDSKDMSNYVRAADTIRAAFNCAVAVVHHCGLDGDRPRGHSSLTGAVEAQLAVRRDHSENIIVTVEWEKDGPADATLASRLEQVEVGTDSDGEAITSCIIVPAEIQAPVAGEPKLSKNQQTMFSILRDAGRDGLSLEDWNDRARHAGLGVSRKADLYDVRTALKAKGLAREFNGRWNAAD